MFSDIVIDEMNKMNESEYIKKLTLNINEPVIVKENPPIQKAEKKNPRISTQQCIRIQYTSFKLFTLDEEKQIFDKLNSKYMITCDEICPETKRRHQHAYIELSSKKQYNKIFEILKEYDNGIHIEMCKGNQNDNIKYIKKDGVYREHGKPKRQGKRNDIRLLLQENKTLQEFIKNEPNTYVRYRSGIEGYYRATVGVDYIPNSSKPVVIWLYGDTGTGKSRSVKDYITAKINEGYRCWRAPLCNKNNWFDGYANQELVYIDELRYSTYSFEDLLQIIDYDAPQVPVKGGFVDFKPKVILITSNQHPSKVYEYINEENKNQLVRRLDCVKEVTRYDPHLLLL